MHYFVMRSDHFIICIECIEVVGVKKKTAFSLLAFYMLVFSMFLGGTIVGNRIITVMSENRPVIREHSIIIDPGHGGEDGGAVSYNGKLESGYNLEIALRLRDMLNLMGYKTVMTRSSDTAIYTQGETIAQKKVSDLKERVRISNKEAHSMLLSIHQNNFQESQYSGAQVFYSKSEGSRELAEEMQEKLVKTLNPTSNRKEKRGDGIYLLEKLNCPGILIECGFLSNPAEEAKLASAEYQKKLSVVISSVAAVWISNT